MEVSDPILESSSGGDSVDSGLDITVAVMVSDIAASDIATYGDINAAALAALDDADYTLNSPLGSTSAWLDSRRCSPQSASLVRVSLNYKSNSAAGVAGVDGVPRCTISTGSAIREKQTNKDAAGNPVTLTYTDIDGKFGPPGAVYGPFAALMTRGVPKATLRFTRTEYEDPTVKARLYTGTVNMAGWLADPGAPARMWRCNGIPGESSDGGASFQVTYEFEAADGGGTWDDDCVFMKDGKVPGDVDAGVNAGNAHKTVIGYIEADFNDLNLVVSPAP